MNHEHGSNCIFMFWDMYIIETLTHDIYISHIYVNTYVFYGIHFENAYCETCIVKLKRNMLWKLHDCGI